MTRRTRKFSRADYRALVSKRQKRHRTRRRYLGLLTRPIWRVGIGLLALAIIILGRLVEEIAPDRTPETRFRVARVIDGDTVELTGGDRLRLLFIDTPESGEPYHDSAVYLLDSLTSGAATRLKFGARQRDGYGRLLAVLNAGGVNVNRELLRRGFAHLYLFKDNLRDTALGAELTSMMAAQNLALDRRSGIWSLKRTPEDHYLTTSRSLRFHRPGCRSVAGKDPTALRRFGHRDTPLREGL
ncbi:MAG: thermonuclease family protein, partial [Candidatus Zixiibacteriota bacterium]